MRLRSRLLIACLLGSGLVLGLASPSSAQKPPAKKQPTHPSDAVAGGGHFYKAYLDKVTWADAKLKCEEQGGYLACITSPQEDAFVISVISKQLGDEKLGDEKNKFWLGGTFDGGQWKWINGEAFRYSPGKLPTDGKAPFLRHAGSRWLTAGNASGLVVGYVCEWDR